MIELDCRVWNLRCPIIQPCDVLHGEFATATRKTSELVSVDLTESNVQRITGPWIANIFGKSRQRRALDPMIWWLTTIPNCFCIDAATQPHDDSGDWRNHLRSDGIPKPCHDAQDYGRT
jgi:hypothetical protein